MLKEVVGGTGLVERFLDRKELVVSLVEETFRAAEKEEIDVILLLCGTMFGGGVLFVLGVGGGGDRTSTSSGDRYSEHLELGFSTRR